MSPLDPPKADDIALTTTSSPAVPKESTATEEITAEGVSTELVLRLVEEQRTTNVVSAHFQFTEDMTAEKANALARVAEMQFAEPARQETERSRHDTHRVAIVSGVVLGGAVLAAAVPAAAWPIAAIIGVLAGLRIVEKIFKTKTPSG